uniref:Transmembrane protein 186 n=1 Tax=Bursaphelenchus xylophilus TaxID=6326 RepID=A0A1I7RRT5_BURXY
MPFFMTSGGLLVREFVKRIKPVQRNGAVVPTRGLFTTTVKRTHRRRTKVMSSTNPFSPDELRQRIGGFSARRLASTNAEGTEEWIPVYRYKKISLCFMIAKAKLYQTILSVGLIPWQTYKMVMGTCTMNEYFSVVGLAFVAPIVLIGFANLFNKIIGVVSYNPENDTFRFGYLSFWGTRLNKIVRADEVIPLTEHYFTYDNKAVLKLTFTDGDYLLLSTRNAELPDEKLAKYLFKDLNYFPVEDGEHK